MRTVQSAFEDVERRFDEVDRNLEGREVIERSSGLEVGNLAAIYQGLPGLRGLWSAGSFDSLGALYDQSGQGRTLTSAGVSPPPFSWESLFPRVEHTAALAQYHNRADEADLRITGTEANVAVGYKGLTVGMWIQPLLGSSGVVNAYIGKWLTTGNRAYYLRKSTGNAFVFSLSADGAAEVNVTGPTLGVDIPWATWCFVVGRFVPSTSIDIFVNGAKFSNVATAPASIHPGTGQFRIGARAGTTFEYSTMQWSIAFICAMQLSDTMIRRLFTRTRSLYGV